MGIQEWIVAAIVGLAVVMVCRKWLFKSKKSRQNSCGSGCGKCGGCG